MRSNGRVIMKLGVVDALENAKSDINELMDEMTNWRDNLQGTALENTMKYSEVEECADTLESAVNNLDGVEIELEGEVEVSLIKKATARWKRLDNALQYLEAVVDRLQNRIDEIEDEITDIEGDDEKDRLEGNKTEGVDRKKIDELEEERDALQEALDNIEECKSECEGVSFPGMY